MNRFPASTVAGFVLAATLAIALSTPYDARAEPALRTDNGQLFLELPGAGAAKSPLRLVVQEWERKAAPASPTSAPAGEVNTVGSIVQSSTTELAFLAPINEPWDEVAPASLSRTDAGVVQTIELSMGFRIDAIYESYSDRVVVRGTLTNTADDPARRERPVTLSLAVPLDPADLVWWSDVRQSEPANSPRELIVPVSTMAGARGVMSRYPFGAMTGPDFGLGLGFPLDQPRIQRIRWDGARHLLIAEVDVAVSPEPTRFPNQVPFEFWLFEFPAEFGFRGAARRYYDLNPDSYEPRLARQGQWMPFTQVDAVARPEDFGFAFHEYHPDVSVAYNNANAIESLVYCEPPVQYLSVGPGEPHTLDTVNRILESKSDRQGSQVRGSATFDTTGKLQVAWVETPWATGARIPTNGDPELPRTARDPDNSFDANWAPYADLYRRRAEDQPLDWLGDAAILDGVVGAKDRALRLHDGENVRQWVTLPASNAMPLILSVRARTHTAARLLVSLRRDTEAKTAPLDLEPAPAFADYDVALGELAAKLGALGRANVLLELEARGGDIFVDAIDAPGLALANAGFDAGRLDSEAVTGLYLDSFEGWDSKDLNYRSEHFATTDFPLTFDTRTGATGQVIVMHNFELAAEARRRLHARGDLLMANTTLYQWSWSAHYFDVLGIETSWGEGPRISPPRLEEMDYLRTMLYHKPYCYLQNVRFENFRGEKVEDYFARCFHSGFWPGFFSFNAAEAPYWQDPSLYNADRIYFLAYTQPQRVLTAAGWEPITLAGLTDAALLVERWGGGPLRGARLDAAAVAFTIYNPTRASRSARLVPDARLLAPGAHLALDLLGGRRRAVDPRDNSVAVELAPLKVDTVEFVARTPAALVRVATRQAALLDELAEKYRRFGFLDDTLRAAAADFGVAESGLAAAVAWGASARPMLEPLYLPEFDRAVRLYRIAVSALLEQQAGRPFEPSLPLSITPGETLVARAGVAYASTPLSLAYRFGTATGRVEFADGEARLPIPAGLSLGDDVTLTIEAADDAASAWPWYEATLTVLPAASFVSLPEEVVMASEKTLEVRLRNNLARPQSGTIAVTGPAPFAAPAPVAVTLAPEAETSARLPLAVSQQRATGDIRGELSIEWRPDVGDPLRQAIPLTLLPRDASLLRSPDVVVRVDSTYYGYNLEPITDGVVDTRDLDWQQAAWASDEGMVPHWVEFEFPEPVEIGEIVVDWAFDAGAYRTSREIHAEVVGAPKSPWRRVASFEGDGPTAATRLTFARQRVSKLRLFQPAGRGSADRPGLLWLGEVEAR